MIETILQAIVFITITAFISHLIDSFVKNDTAGIITAAVFIAVCSFIFFGFLGASPDPHANFKWAFLWGLLTLIFFAWGTRETGYKDASRFVDGLGTFTSIGLYACLF